VFLFVILPKFYKRNKLILSTLAICIILFWIIFFLYKFILVNGVVAFIMMALWCSLPLIDWLFKGDPYRPSAPNNYNILKTKFQEWRRRKRLERRERVLKAKHNKACIKYKKANKKYWDTWEEYYKVYKVLHNIPEHKGPNRLAENLRKCLRGERDFTDDEKRQWEEVREEQRIRIQLHKDS